MTTADLTLAAGTTAVLTATVDREGLPADLTGYTVSARFGSAYNAPAAVELQLGQGASVTPEGLVLTLTPEQTRRLTGLGRWQLDVTDAAGQVTRLYEGAYRVSSEVRRP